MGCNLSSDDCVVAQDKQLNEYLSQRDIQLVRYSWNLVQDDLEHLGLIMFQRLFIQQRHLKKLFTKLMTREISGEVIFEESKLRSHGRIVMETLGAAVECLDNSAQLTTLLFEVGEIHAHYGVLPDMIPMLRPAIIVALEEKIGLDFNAEIGQAWERVFNYIGSNIMKGISKQNKSNNSLRDMDSLK